MKGSFIASIDGFSGTGKTTMGWLLAKELRWIFISTGNIYRALFHYYLNSCYNDFIQFANEGCRAICVQCQSADSVLLNGELLTTELRTSLIENGINLFVQTIEIRKIVSRIVYEITQLHHAVVEGRDIGTIVCPNSLAKFFFVRDYTFAGLVDDLLSENVSSLNCYTLSARDKNDILRDISPIRISDNAVLVYSFEQPIGDLLHTMVKCVKTKFSI